MEPSLAEQGDDDGITALRKLYYDPAAGLWSINKLHQKLKAQGVHLPVKKVKQFLKDQEVSQVFHQRAVKTHFPLMSDAPFQRIQVDLLDVSNENYVKNNGVKFLFLCIDVYTRFVVAVPLTSKSEKECTRGLQQVLREIAAKTGPYGLPSQMDSDNEAAFLSRGFKQVCREHQLHQHLNVPGDYKSKGIVERFNRTLRTMLQKYMVAFHTEVWIDKLQDLITNYNHTYHRTLKTTPTQAIENNDSYEKDRTKQIGKAAKQPFNRDVIEVGDRVRVLIKKELFDKGTDPRWSKHISSVERVDNGQFYVTERKGSYRKAELLKVDKTEQWDRQSAGSSLSPGDATVDDSLVVVDSGSEGDATNVSEGTAGPSSAAAILPTTNELRRAKRIRRALNKEGVSEVDITSARRSRTPSTRVLSQYGERIIWS